MKIRVLGALAIGLVLTACGAFFGNVKGSGNVVTQVMSISGFTEVEVGNTFRVTITQAAEYSVVIDIDDNLVQFLDVKKVGDTLEIRLQPGRSARSATMKARVSMPKLTAVELSGASKGFVQGFVSDANFDARVSGASHLTADIRAPQTGVELTGASAVHFEGSGTTLSVSASGASNANLENFTVETAAVHLSGASVARLNVSRIMDPVSLTGASKLIYSGNPSFRNFKTSGASAIIGQE